MNLDPAGAIGEKAPMGNRRRLLLVVVIIKAIVGSVLTVLLVGVGHRYVELREHQHILSVWEDTHSYGVFYPHLAGEDGAGSGSPELGLKISQARDLYPILEASGALFIDASNYESESPELPPVPAWPILVNSNYLDRYEVLDAAGERVSVPDAEQDWVVLVPDKYRDREASIRTFFEKMRVGGHDIDGAVQVQERVLSEPVPEAFRSQQVQLLWIQSGQAVFSFNSDVNPKAGNVIVDPIIEVMTPSNSLTADRLNAITGEPNTPLKVKVDGDPKAVWRQLEPTLTELHLDDNLPHLVTTHEVMLAEIDQVGSDVGNGLLVGLVLFIAVLVLGASSVTVARDALGREIIVRRMHGHGLVSAYRRLWQWLVAAWGAQALVSFAILFGYSNQNYGVGGPVVPSFASSAAMAGGFILVSVVLEIAFVGLSIVVSKRRSTSTRLKEI